MLLTPITIPRVDTIPELRDALVIVLNRLASQVTQGSKVVVQTPASSFDVAAFRQDLLDTLYSSPIQGLRVLGSIDGVSITLNKNGVTTKLSSTISGSYTTGIQIYTTAGSAEEVFLSPGILSISETVGNNTKVFLNGGGPASDASMQLYSGSSTTHGRGARITVSANTHGGLIQVRDDAATPVIELMGSTGGIRAAGFNPHAGGVDYTGATAAQTVIATLSPCWVRLVVGSPDKLQSSTDAVNWYDVSPTNGIGFFQGSTGATFTFKGGALTSIA